MTPARCAWPSREPMLTYHDTEWGVPVHDDQMLYAHLVLDGAQAGLSWETILRKRPAYLEAFDQFDPRKVARYDQRKVARLLKNAGIVRNRLKIESAIKNARALLKLQEELGSFDNFLWQFVGGKTRINRFSSLKELPARTPESDAMSKELKRRGFSFVGSTICYAFMQAVGMVNDHTINCYRHGELAKLARAR
ncbi:MAG: DNA-3-methyladenine glycosylase I [Phycisphaeraceae bacterium]